MPISHHYLKTELRTFFSGLTKKVFSLNYSHSALQRQVNHSPCLSPPVHTIIVVKVKCPISFIFWSSLKDEGMLPCDFDQKSQTFSTLDGRIHNQHENRCTNTWVLDNNTGSRAHTHPPTHSKRQTTLSQPLTAQIYDIQHDHYSELPVAARFHWLISGRQNFLILQY